MVFQQFFTEDNASGLSAYEDISALLKEVNAAAFFNNLVRTLGMDVELLHHEFVPLLNLPDSLLIRIDEKLVYRAFENLTNNAIR